MNLLGDGPTQSRLFGEPLASGSRHGMPSQLHGAGLAVDFHLTRRDDIGFLAKPELMFNL